MLRDKGLLYDAGSPKIYFELGWMFQNKIAGNTDDANQLYKNKWAKEMTELLGSGYPDYEALVKDPATIKRMKEHYKLIPEIMQEVDKKYGPLDWCCPLSHSIYWGYQATQHAPKEKFIPGDRMIYQSLAQSFIYGKKTCGNRSNEKYTPDLNLLSKTINSYESARKKYPDDKTVKNAYYNFMYLAITILKKHNMPDAAQNTYNQWQQNKIPDMTIPPFKKIQ